jgi:hypothetical protein
MPLRTGGAVVADDGRGSSSSSRLTTDSVADRHHSLAPAASPPRPARAIDLRRLRSRTPGCVRYEVWYGERRLLRSDLVAECDGPVTEGYLRHFFEQGPGAAALAATPPPPHLHLVRD